MYPGRAMKNGAIKRFKMGRVCKKHGCRQRLSIYNSEVYCHVHYREILNKLGWAIH
jgi:hypothetical protein